MVTASRLDDWQAALCLLSCCYICLFAMFLPLLSSRGLTAGLVNVQELRHRALLSPVTVQSSGPKFIIRLSYRPKGVRSKPSRTKTPDPKPLSCPPPLEGRLVCSANSLRTSNLFCLSLAQASIQSSCHLSCLLSFYHSRCQAEQHYPPVLPEPATSLTP